MTTYISAELRRTVYNRAEGRCEYCLINEKYSVKRHEVDHIYAEKHGGETQEENLCLSCFMCNRYKGSDMASLDPETNEATFLFHPRRDVWTEHFEIQDAVIIPLTQTARATANLLHFNDKERIAEREVLIKLGRYP